MTGSKLASRIDHTFLKPQGTEAEIQKICAEAIQYGFATVCVRPEFVELAAKLLHGTSVLPIAVVGFPTGDHSTSEKVEETRRCIDAGAQEIDMVLHLPALKKKDYAFVLKDIQSVVAAAHPRAVKVILETGALTHDEKVMGCALSKAAGARFVKTSTGFGPGGATVDDIRLMRQIVGPDVGVKASGGIRTTKDAVQMIDAGADRIGASSSVAIVSGSPSDSGEKY